MRGEVFAQDTQQGTQQPDSRPSQVGSNAHRILKGRNPFQRSKFKSLCPVRWAQPYYPLLALGIWMLGQVHSGPQVVDCPNTSYQCYR